jgi:hypothetical protein
VYENVLVGVVSVDEAVAISDVEPLHNTGNGVGDDLFLGRLWSVASCLFIVILSIFSVNGGSGLLLDGLFCNFSGHIGWLLLVSLVY